MNRTMIAVAAGVMTLAGAGSASAQALVIEGPYAAPVYEVAPAPYYAAPVVVAPAPRVYAAPPIAYDERVIHRGPIAREVVVTEPQPILEPAPGIVYSSLDVQAYAEDVPGPWKGLERSFSTRCATIFRDAVSPAHRSGRIGSDNLTGAGRFLPHAVFARNAQRAAGRTAHTRAGASAATEGAHRRRGTSLRVRLGDRAG